MTCSHLKELYQICQTHNLRLSSADLIRIVCPQCGVEENCPSILIEQYDTKHDEPRAEADESGPKDSKG
jgi:hypothetical protein